ncbi:MAG: hypothetical protein B6I19_02345, partial [Bacteroidetes bacterium 4572_114]
MNLLNFIERFPEEKDCVNYLKTIRERSGVVCNSCGHTEHNWLDSTDQFECKRCGNLMSIKSGTIMENSELPIKYWFTTMYILTSSIKSYSASELQKKLDYPEYGPVCEMLYDLRFVLEKEDDEYIFERLLSACTKNQINANLPIAI